MHSSRMHTAHNSCRHGGVSTPPGSGTPQSRHPPRAGTHLGAGTTPWSRNPSDTPQPDPPQLPLGCGPGDQIPLNFPLGCGPGDPFPPAQQDPCKLPPCMWISNLQGLLGYHPSSWKPAARHAEIPPAMHAGIPPHPHPRPTPGDRHTPVKA